MEAIEGNNIPTETLSGISSSSQPTGPPQFGSDMRSENGGDSEVVVTTTVVEKTEVTVVTIVQENNNEAKEKDKDAVFGDLFDGDDGIDVNFTDEKLVPGGDLMDVNYNNNNDAKPKEKEGVGHLFDFDEGVNINFTEEKSVLDEDPMDVSPLNQKHEKPETVAGLFEYTDDINENTNNEENVNEGTTDDEKAGVFEFTEDNNEGTKVNSIDKRTGVFEFTEEDMDDEKTNLENGEKNQEIDEEEEEKHDYVVGDFVWGKIKSHPWWPGQIYDPSTASEYANSIKRKGHLLVAYFGDGSFSWCSPSQLKPFIDHFQEMSNQSDSRKFTHAVKTALDTVSNLIESELIGKCVDADVANGGIKPGVPVPKGNTIKVLMDKMSPIELVLKLNMYATFAPGYELELGLELTVVKSWLGAFYFQKGGYVLPEYHEPKCIEGLEDKTGTGITDSNGNGPSECGDNSNKSNQKRKQKSVAELLSVEDEPRTKKAKPVKDSGGSGRKRKVAAPPPPPALVVPAVESPESDISGGVEDDTMYSPRQRKKSKYLSPPYLSPTAVKLSAGSGSGSFKEPKPEPEKEPKGSEMGEASPRKKPRLKKHNDKVSDKVSKEEGKMGIDAGVDVDKVLSGLLLTALDPTGSVEKKRILGVTRFVSSFRSSVFENRAKPEVEMEVEVEESDVGFVKRKVEEMREMVNGCGEEGEMGEEVKAKLEGVIMEVLERVK